MASDRLIVVPANPPRGLICAAGLLGTGHGCAIAAIAATARWWAPTLFTAFAGRSSLLIGLVFMALVALLPAALAARLVVRLTHRRPLVIAAGAAYAAAGALAAAVVQFLVQPDSQRFVMSPISPLISVAVSVSVLPIASALLFLFMRWYTRVRAFRLIEQTGNLCWSCAYELGSDRLTNCPECGTPVDPRRFRRAWFVAGAQRRLHWARPVLAIAALSALAWCGVVAATQTIPLARIYALLSTRQHGQIVWTAGSSFAFDEITVGFPLRDNSSTWAVIAVGNRTHWMGRGVTIALMELSPTPASPSLQEVVNCNPVMPYATLTNAQALAIGRDGVPKGLMERMLEVRDAGRTGSFGPGTVQTRYEAIDPDPSFTDE